MTVSGSGMSLRDGLDLAGMTVEQLWLRLLGLGGDCGQLEIEAYVLNLLSPDPYVHNLIAQALNEHFMDMGEDHPVGYWDTAKSQ
jgi:hypothetical protein